MTRHLDPASTGAGSKPDRGDDRAGETPPPEPPPVGPTYFPGGQRLAFFLLLLAILALAWFTVRPVALAVVLAAAVASLSYDLYRRLVRRVGGRPRLAAGLFLAMLFVGVLGPVVALLAFGAERLVEELSALIPRLPELQSWLRGAADRLGPTVGGPLRKAAESLGATLVNAAPRLAQTLTGWLGIAGSALIKAGVALFLFAIALFYFYLNGDPWRERLIRLLPIDPRHARAFIARFRSVSIAVLIGNVGTSAIHGVVSGLGYWILGVEAPFLWAIATAFASLIPLFGTALVWVPLAIALGVTHGWLRGVLLLLWGAIVVGLSDNLARPLLMEKRLGLHPLWVFIAVFGGLASWGAAGLFLGPLVMALTVAALDIYDTERDPPPPLPPPAALPPP